MRRSIFCSARVWVEWEYALQQDEISIEFEFWVKYFSEMGPTLKMEGMQFFLSDIVYIMYALSVCIQGQVLCGFPLISS